jgi:hypothetical protein
LESVSSSLPFLSSLSITARVAIGRGANVKYSHKECQLLRRGGQTKQLEMPVTMLPNVKNEQLLFVTLDFKPCKRCSDCRKVLTERSDLVAAGALFLKAVNKIKQSIFDFRELRPIPFYCRTSAENSAVPLATSRAPPPPDGLPHTLETTALW